MSQQWVPPLSVITGRRLLAVAPDSPRLPAPNEVPNAISGVERPLALNSLKLRMAFPWKSCSKEVGGLLSKNV